VPWRVLQQGGEGVERDVAVSDVGVAIAPATKWVLGVVDVHGAQAVESEELDGPGEDARDAIRGVDFVARREQVAGIEAHTELSGALRELADASEMLETVSNHCSLTGRHLEQEAGRPGGRAAEHVRDAGRDQLESGLFPCTEVSARVDDERIDTQSAAPVELVGEAASGLFENDRVGGREVDEIGGMSQDGRLAGAGTGATECLDLVGQKLSSGPSVRALDEDLKCLDLEGRGPPERCGQATSDGDVGTEGGHGQRIAEERTTPAAG